MSTRDAAFSKAAGRLQSILAAAAPDQELRVIFRIHPTRNGSPSAKSSEPNRSAYDSRSAYREALLRYRREQNQHEIGSTRQAFQDLGLDTWCGELMRTVVAEGRADAIRKSLELPGVESAMLDENISLTSL